MSRAGSAAQQQALSACAHALAAAAAGGELLDAVNTHGPFSEEDARTIFLQLMRGVQYLHSV